MISSLMTSLFRYSSFVLLSELTADKEIPIHASTFRTALAICTHSYPLQQVQGELKNLFGIMYKLSLKVQYSICAQHAQ